MYRLKCVRLENHDTTDRPPARTLRLCFVLPNIIILDALALFVMYKLKCVLLENRDITGWPPARDLKPGIEEQELQQLVSPLNGCKLQELCTDDATGLLAVPICNLLSSSLTVLGFSVNQEMECFTKEQEDALHLLVSLQKLMFYNLSKLQSLPAGLQKLTNLKELSVYSCPVIRSLPEDGLPKSLQKLIVWNCGSAELKQQCKGLVGTIPKIILQLEDL
ncbi:uncharacterized protein LOC125532333 [Triticum urartu]|uniref:uncharacterized protein LOC125532333 n=1 Tax=Triticum urartu TaxID=4572 RepID=UPI002042E5C5|nr:uncharacterized protein LOC125532333 [Triticum urartu]